MNHGLRKVRSISHEARVVASFPSSSTLPSHHSSRRSHANVRCQLTRCYPPFSLSLACATPPQSSSPKNETKSKKESSAPKRSKSLTERDLEAVLDGISDVHDSFSLDPAAGGWKENARQEEEEEKEGEEEEEVIAPPRRFDAPISKPRLNFGSAIVVKQLSFRSKAPEDDFGPSTSAASAEKHRHFTWSADQAKKQKEDAAAEERARREAEEAAEVRGGDGRLANRLAAKRRAEEEEESLSFGLDDAGDDGDAFNLDLAGDLADDNEAHAHSVSHHAGTVEDRERELEKKLKKQREKARKKKEAAEAAEKAAEEAKKAEKAEKIRKRMEEREAMKSTGKKKKKKEKEEKPKKMNKMAAAAAGWVGEGGDDGRSSPSGFAAQPDKSAAPAVFKGGSPAEAAAAAELAAAKAAARKSALAAGAVAAPVSFDPDRPPQQGVLKVNSR